MKIKSISVFGILFSCLSLCCAGLATGFNAYINSDYATALIEFQAAAGRGDARGQFMLGKMFGRGLGVPQDSDQSNKWFQLASNQGNSNAQYEIGNGLTYGSDDREVEGLKLLELSAGQNNVNSMYMLGIIYSFGRGEIPRDTKKAIKWLSMAAARGEKFAQRRLDIIQAKSGIEHGLAVFHEGAFFEAMTELKAELALPV